MHAALDRDEVPALEGSVWYQDLPDSFVCRCGKTTVDLSYIRANLHGLLGLPLVQNGQISLVPRYHRAALDHVIADLVSLLDSDPEEEAVQQFLTSNPVTLAVFAPTRIFYKPQILTRYRADFAILNHRNELVLIELEKPGRRLLKKDGGTCAELQHALDQVKDWLHEMDEHRQTVLSCMDLDKSAVARIRGTVIMGRDRDYGAEALRKLRKRGVEDVEVLTYDDLVAGLSSVIRSLGD